MKRTIYHGSEFIIQKPEFGKGKLHNDYGRGFYCTEDIDLAREWSADENRDGIVNKYLIDETGLKILRLEEPEFTSLHWIELLLSNRDFSLTTPLAIEGAKYLHEHFHADTSDADVIIGYRADDSYFSFAKDFVNGTISCAQLGDTLKFGNLGLQYFIKSKKAFERLEFVDSEYVESKIWYPKKEIRDSKARQDYFNMDVKKYIRGGLYMSHILEQEVKPDDLRIR